MTTIPNNLKFYVFAIITAVYALMPSKAQAQSEKVQWMSMQEALDRSAETPKKIFVDVYTDWCGWCKKMDKATFQRPHIARYLNEHFYNVKLDAETKDEIIYKGKTHKYLGKGRRGYNTIAAEITRGRLSYPTIVFMNEDQDVLQPIPGFQDPKTFELIMTFFAGDHYQDTPWKKYEQTYEYMNKEVPVQPASLQQGK